MQVVSYSSTLYYYTLTFFTKMPEPARPFFKFLSPFPPAVWALLSSSAAALAAALWIFHRTYRGGGGGGVEFPHRLR